MVIGKKKKNIETRRCESVTGLRVYTCDISIYPCELKTKDATVFHIFFVFGYCFDHGC